VIAVRRGLSSHETSFIAGTFSSSSLFASLHRQNETGLARCPFYAAILETAATKIVIITPRLKHTTKTKDARH
jgi:hypothetical protein